LFTFGFTRGWFKGRGGEDLIGGIGLCFFGGLIVVDGA